MLFNEPKLLKCARRARSSHERDDFSALQRAEIAEITVITARVYKQHVFQCSSTSRNCWNCECKRERHNTLRISVLFNEPKLLKSWYNVLRRFTVCISVLFNEPKLLKSDDRRYGPPDIWDFSALQRAEIAEIHHTSSYIIIQQIISVLFNEPKLLK